MGLVVPLGFLLSDEPHYGGDMYVNKKFQQWCLMGSKCVYMLYLHMYSELYFCILDAG